MKYNFDFEVKTLKYEDTQSILEKTGILVITGNKIEKEAFLKYLLPIPEEEFVVNIVHNKHNYLIGRFGCHLIAHVHISASSSENIPSFSTITNAVDCIKPKLIIMVGVAYGIDKSKQKIGDVLISKKVINYEVYDIENITSTGAQPPSGRLLFNIFTNIIDWSHYVNKNRQAEIISGDVLSGKEFIENPLFCRNLKKTYPDAIGGELELTAISTACIEGGVNEWILVKSIGDWADGKKNKKCRPLAADAASSLTFHVLSKNNIFNDSKLFSYSEEQVNSENNKYILNASKGSPLWTFNRLRSSLLSLFIEDLKSFENTGYPDDICAAVQRDLNALRTEIAKLPRILHGGRSLTKRFDKFLEIYRSWNEVDGNSIASKMARIKLRNKLKNERDNISEIIRFNQKLLIKGLDYSNADTLLDLQEELILIYPDVFPNFKKAVLKVRRILDKSKHGDSSQN